MFNFIKNREKEYFKRLFKKRFKTELNISNERSSLEFFNILIDEIEKHYQIEIKKSDEIKRYIEKEKIILSAKIELLKSKDFDVHFKYLSFFYSLVIPIMVSVMGFAFINAKSIVDFAIQTELEQIRSNGNITNINDIYDFLTKTYSDYNIESINFIGKIQFVGLLFIFIIFSYMIIRDVLGRENNDRIITFERICLDILENLKI